MAAKQKITIEIDGDGKGAQKALGGVSAGTVALGNIMAQMATMAVDVLVKSMKALTGEMLKAVDAASIQQKNEIALAQSMQTANTFTKEAFKANLEYAASLQQITTFGDEEILTVQKSLIAFGLQGQALRDVTRATLDLSTATGMNLRAAGDLVAKSVGSTTNALARYGIEVTAGTERTTRAKEVVDGITRLYGGQAQAAAKSFSGQITQLKNMFGDLYEEIGLVIINSEGLGSIFDLLKKSIIESSKWVITHREELGILVKEGIVFVINAVGWLVKAIAFLSQTWTDVGNVFSYIMGGMLTGIQVIVKGMALFYAPAKEWVKSLEDMKMATIEQIQEENKAAQKRLGFFTGIIDGVTEMSQGVQSASAAYKSLTDSIADSTKEQADNTVKNTEYIMESIDIARGYTEIQLGEFNTRQTAMKELLANNEITQTEYNNWLLTAGKKVNSEEAKRLSGITGLYTQMYSTITSVSKTQSDLVLKDKKNSMAALEDAFKGSLSQMLDMAVDYAVKEIGVTAALESGKAAAAGPLSFGMTLLLIPLIAAAATAAKAIIHSVAGFAGGGIVGPGGSKLPLPSFASNGAGAPALVVAHAGEAIGTPATLAAAGIGGIVLNNYFYGDIASDVDVDAIGDRLAEKIKEGSRGSM